MAHSPAFQFYPADYTIGTKFFTPAERGAYVDCLCHQWDEGSIPGDDARDMAVVMRCSEDQASAIWARISKKFVRCDDGLWRNQRLEVERQKQASFREQQAEKGRRSAAAKSQPKSNSGSTAVDSRLEPDGNQNSTAVDSRLEPDGNREVNRTSTLQSSSSSSSSRERDARAPEPEPEPLGRARRPNPYAHAVVQAPNGRAFWEGPIFNIPHEWARKTLAAANGKAAGSTIVLFAQALTERLQREGGEAPTKGFLGWLDTEWTAYRQPVDTSSAKAIDATKAMLDGLRARSLAAIEDRRG